MADQVKIYQLPPSDYSNFNRSTQRHQVIRRWGSLDPCPKLTIESARHWPGRFVIALTQKQLRTELVPSLKLQEAQDIALLFRRFSVSLEFDDHGRLVDRVKIYSLLQAYLSRPSAFAPIRAQVQGSQSEFVAQGAKGVKL